MSSAGSRYRKIKRPRSFCSTGSEAAAGRALAVFCCHEIVRNLFVNPVGLHSGGPMGFLSVDPYRIDQISSFVFRRTGYFGYHLLSFECAALLLRAIKKIGKTFCKDYGLCDRYDFVFLSVDSHSIRSTLGEDVLASCLIGGIICGQASVSRCGWDSSGGGMDILGTALIKPKKLSAWGKLNLMVNAVLYGICLFCLMCLR